MKRKNETSVADDYVVIYGSSNQTEDGQQHTLHEEDIITVSVFIHHI
jgi:hypothetical protein